MSSIARRLRRTIQRRNIELAVRLAGCTCKFGIRHLAPNHHEAQHDLDCPAVDHATQIIVAFTPPECQR